MAFLIIACVLLAINILFIAVAFIHSLLKKDVEEPRFSMAQMMMNRQSRGDRTSLPQVTIFNAVIRLSTSSNRASAQNEDGEMNNEKKLSIYEKEAKPVAS